MSLNWREIDLILDELPLQDAHIQQIVQPDFRNIFFQIYQPGNPFWLRICLETGRTRLHRSTTPVRKQKTRQRFAQLLHSRVKGGKIISARHVNADRIVRLDVRRAGELTTLWIRLWGGAANIIATDASGTIIDAFFRRPKRGEVSGGHYAGPEDLPDEKSIAKSNSRKDRFESRFQVQEKEPQGTINAQVEAFYGEITESSEREHLLDSVTKVLQQRRNKLEQQLDRARTRLAEAESADRLKVYGDLIAANLHRITPGDRWLETEDYTNDNSPITIELNPVLSPRANAERCYDRAKKARRRRTALAEEVQNLETRFHETEARLEKVAETELPELRRLLDEMVAPASGKSQSGPVTPGLRFVSGEFTILVGRNARENDLLLRHHVRGNDLWLHTRDYPGGYVFVRAQKGKTVPLGALLDAGNLAVHFSKAKANGRAELYYTQVKYLRRSKNGPLGLVLPTHEKNLSVVVEQDRLARLLV